MTVLLGIDGGLSHMGLAVWGAGEIMKFTCLVTEPSDKKRAVRASEDNARRAMELWDGIDGFAGHYDHVVLCTETLSLPRNAGSSAKIGIAFGVVMSWAHSHGYPIVQASPQEVKLEATGLRSASKELILTAVEGQYPEVGKAIRRMRKADQEHVADAVAIIGACMKSEVVKAALRR